MSFISEFMVLGLIGSVVLGPKRVAKLVADGTRMMNKLKAVQAELSTQLSTELAESDLRAPKAAQHITPSQDGASATSDPAA